MEKPALRRIPSRRAASDAGAEGSETKVAAASGGDPSGTDSAEESGTGGGDAKTGLKPLPRKQYGIILVSNAQTNFQDMNGVLKGSPIYTVHIEVPEAPRKWTLQFCIPDSANRRLDVSSGVIRITPRKKVAPPFPREKKALHLEQVRDPNLQRPSRVMVYATVDEEGALGNLKVVRGADPQTDNTILAHLRSWEFCPPFEARNRSWSKPCSESRSRSGWRGRNFGSRLGAPTVRKRLAATTRLIHQWPRSLFGCGWSA